MNPGIIIFAALVLGEVISFTLYFFLGIHKIVGIPVSILILSSCLFATILAGWIIMGRIGKK